MNPVPQVLYSILTLYMLMILLRWFGPYLSLDVEEGRLKWIARLTDPLIVKIRSILPSLGPMDFGPLAALVLVWLVRTVFVGATS